MLAFEVDCEEGRLNCRLTSRIIPRNEKQLEAEGAGSFALEFTGSREEVDALLIRSLDVSELNLVPH